jgi:NAD+ kinase
MVPTGEKEMKLEAIGVIANPTKPESKKGLEKVINTLKLFETKIFVDEETGTLLEDESQVVITDRLSIPEKVNAILVLGGDGTFLTVARLVDKKEVPILGINLGRLGFLTEVSIDEVEESLKRLFNGGFKIERRFALRAKVIRKNGHVSIYRCVNEVAVKRDTLARIIELEILSDSEFMTVLRGDGVIVATPTGSTAYSLSAGGPIIIPTLNAMLLTPICPHALTMRPIVLDGRITLRIGLKTKSETVMVIFDGQEGIELREGDTIEISRSPYDLLVLRDTKKSYYETLRGKLKWG